MEHVVERALRYVFNDFDSPYRVLLCKANLVPLRVIMLRDLLINIHKIRLGMLPPFDDDFCKMKHCNYNMRNLTLVQPRYNTYIYGYKSMRYSGAMLYNTLSNDFKLLDLQGFKSKIMSWVPRCSCGICILCTL